MKINTQKFWLIMTMLFMITFMAYGVLYGDNDTSSIDVMKYAIGGLITLLATTLNNFFKKPGT